MSLLKSITAGRKQKPLAVLLHGVHGIGKSTFGEKAKGAIFIGSEENDELDASRFPKIITWSQLKAQLQTLLDEDHDFKTVVIDTMDSLEQVAQGEILSGANKAKTMATAMGGFGKAFEQQSNMFLDIRDNYLIPLRDNKGMNIVILCHSEKVKHEDPITNTQYDHYQTAMHKKIKPIFEDWVSAILFANFELYKAERESDGKEYAVGDGSRRIFTEERPSHVAKNRFNLDYEMELDYRTFAKGVLSYYKNAPKISTEKKVINQDNGTTVTIEKTKEVESKSGAKEEIIGKEEKIDNSQTDDVAEIKFQIESLMIELDGEILEKVATAYKRAKDDKEKLLKVKKRIEKTLA